MAEPNSERVDHLLAKAEEHLRHADEAYWDEDTIRVALHLSYAQAASTTAMALIKVSATASLEQEN